MSINKRPFFSIIIPCYNSRKTIGKLLETIKLQQLQKQDIQIVISDDCSTESYQDIIDQFTNDLFITQVKTDYNYCPGNTRQKGVEAAIGQWICFSDHDDQFILESLKKLKNVIEQHKQCNTIFFTKFLKKNLKNEYYEMPSNAGWTHGKFFNLDNFWKKYNIHYVKDMTSHQDVCICTQIEFIRTAYNLQYYQVDLPTYVWIEDPNSLSNRKYTEQQKERVFLDVFLIDYVEATAGTSYSKYKELKINKPFVEKNIKDVMLYSYFYLEFAKDRVPQYLEKNFDHIRKYLTILKEQFNCSIQDLYNFYKFDNKQGYQEIFKMALGQTGMFLYQFSFKEWLQWIWDKKYIKA